MLFSHSGFSVDEAFGLIDESKDGVITAAEISDIIQKHCFDQSDL